MWLVMEYHLAHNLTTLSFAADVFSSVNRGQYTLGHFFLNVLGHWPFSFSKDVLSQQLSGGLDFRGLPHQANWWTLCLYCGC